MRWGAILLATLALSVCQLAPVQGVVTNLPAEGLEHLTPTELYPYWDQFYFSSPTFREAWDRANRSARLGYEVDWNSITNGSLMLAQAYRHLIDDDRWWLKRSPNLTYPTYDELRELAVSIDTHRQARKLFFLLLYTRDLGRALTGRGQYHQLEGAPIVAQILRELGYEDSWVEVCSEWAENHSVPAETYLGEVSPATLERLFDRFGSVEELPMLEMFAILSLLEVTCLRYDTSGLCQANGAIIARIGSGDVTLIDEIRTSRLYRIANASLLNSDATDEEHQAVHDRTAQRYEVIGSLIQMEPRVARLLEEVDLHYLANTLPRMEPAAVAVLLIVSSRWMECGHVINMSEIDVREFGEMVQLGRLLPTIDEKTGWLIWKEQ